MSPPLPLWKQPSPFEPVLPHGTHLAPQHVKRHLQALRSELEEARTEAIRLRNALKVAEANIDTIHSVINAHCRILPNINDSMPSEILAHIFSFTFTAPLNVSDYESGPWMLGRVCSRWRTVAWQTPTLWSSFRVAPTNNHPLIPPYRLLNMLTRSRQCPLTVHMESAPSDIQTLIIQHSFRFKSLSVYHPSRYPPVSLNLQKLPMLTDLTVETTHASLSLPPNLIRLKYRGSVVSLERTLGPQLTHLTIQVSSGSTVRGYFAALSCCPNLVTFEDHTDFWSVKDFGNRIVHFPRLERLLLHHVSMVHIFTCPALRTFVLSKGEPVLVDIMEFDSFLNRSACNLREVFIEGETDSTFNFMDIFPRVPRIEIDFSGQVTEELLRTLTSVLSSQTDSATRTPLRTLRIILPLQTIVRKDQRYRPIDRILVGIARSASSTLPLQLTYNLMAIEDDEDDDYDENGDWFSTVDNFVADRLPARRAETVYAMIQDTRLYRALLAEGLSDRVEIDVINFEDWVTS